MAGSRRRKGGSEHGDENHRLLNALGHRRRRRTMRLMSDGREASPCDLARELGQALGNVAYHVRVLANADALKSLGHRPVKGATKHLYTWSLEPSWAREMLDKSKEEDERKSS